MTAVTDVGDQQFAAGAWLRRPRDARPLGNLPQTTQRPTQNLCLDIYFCEIALCDFPGSAGPAEARRSAALRARTRRLNSWITRAT